MYISNTSPKAPSGVHVLEAGMIGIAPSGEVQISAKGACERSCDNSPSQIPDPERPA